MVNATHVTEEVRFETEEEIKGRYTEVNFESGKVKGAGIPVISTGRTAYVDDSEASTLLWVRPAAARLVRCSCRIRFPVYGRMRI